MRTPTKSETRGGSTTTSAYPPASPPGSKKSNPQLTSRMTNYPSNPANVAAPNSVDASLEDANPKSGSFLTSARKMFSDKCSEPGKQGDDTTEPNSVLFGFILACCVVFPILMVVLTSVRYQKSSTKSKQKNRMWVLGAVFFQLLVPILCYMGMYASYSTCNPIYGYVIGVMICLISWLSSTYGFLSGLDGSILGWGCYLGW
jgi:heme/copper-type cytochrome/quinol oxidase subunit 4